MIVAIVILLVAVVIVFSVQNAAPVAVTFLGWQTQASLAIIIFLAVATGAVLGVAVMSSWMIKRAVQAKKQKKAEKTLPGGPDTRDNQRL
ncbi:MAG TPA: LapA family protein [Nitrospirota bacterium]|nr:LapA family protein [Nitrospirota bacterium]